jgi:hypothetical protein
MRLIINSILGNFSTYVYQSTLVIYNDIRMREIYLIDSSRGTNANNIYSNIWVYYIITSSNISN